MSVFGKNLNKLLQEKKIGKSKLADLLDISHASVSEWINKGTTPRTKRLEAIAKILGVTVNELLYEAVAPIAEKEDMVLISKEVLEAKDREIALLRQIVELKKDNEHLKNIEVVNEGQ